MRDPFYDCLDVKIAGHFPSFFSNNHISGENCYLSGKQFIFLGTKMKLSIVESAWVQKNNISFNEDLPKKNSPFWWVSAVPWGGLNPAFVVASA